MVDEASLELHRNGDDRQNEDHAALLAVFPHVEGEYDASPIYFRAVAQDEASPCQFVDEAGLELHRYSDQDRGRNHDHAALFSVSATPRRKMYGNSIYFRAVAQREVKP